MTVISAVISTHCIAVSSDSLITVFNKSKKTFKRIETKRPKIIRVEKFNACFSYWGLAAKSEYSKWKTYDWLKSVSYKAKDSRSLSEYADFVTDKLSKELRTQNLETNGIGIHLTGYEFIDGYKIPELFLITNYTDESYSKIGELNVSRHLYLTIPEDIRNGQESISLNEKQHKVREFLQSGRIFIFNNGDPEMFNPLFNGYSEVMKLSKKRNLLKDSSDINIYRNMARRPIEMAVKAQKDFYKDEKIIVGGRVHDLVIEKNIGSFSSMSGV